MKHEQVALQLYTLRDHLATREDIDATLARVRDIGYPAVELAGVDWAQVTEAELVERCRSLGLTICATHEPAQALLEAPDAVVGRLRALGCTHTSYPYPAGVDFGDPGQVDALVRGLEQAGQVLHRNGMVLAYHNHHLEFRRLGGTPILEKIFAETSPQFVQAELDTYWVQYGGGDPVAWCRRLAGRLPLLHLKDYGIDANNQVVFREVGAGNLDMPAIVAAAEAAGCRWFIVEQDTCPGDPFEAVARSLDYVERELVTG